MNTETKILQLLNSTNLPAPSVTQSLKTVGKGNMLEGIRNVHDYAYFCGNKHGKIEGGITVLALGGIAYYGYATYKAIRSKISEVKKHRELETRIYEAFESECNDTLNEEVN